MNLRQELNDWTIEDWLLNSFLAFIILGVLCFLSFISYLTMHQCQHPKYLPTSTVNGQPIFTKVCDDK
jgi:hypothetical protein